MRFAPLFCTSHDYLPQRPWPQTPERAHLNPVCLCLRLSLCMCVCVCAFISYVFLAASLFINCIWFFSCARKGKEKKRRLWAATAGGVCYRIWFVLSSAHEWKCAHTQVCLVFYACTHTSRWHCTLNVAKLHIQQQQHTLRRHNRFRFRFPKNCNRCWPRVGARPKLNRTGP